MKYCLHCGKPIDDRSEICLGCGCPTVKKHTVTFERAKQWYLINPPMHVQISGENTDCELAVESGESVSAQLPEGTYKIHIYSSPRYHDCMLNLQADTKYRLAWNRFSGRIEVWEL